MSESRTANAVRNIKYAWIGQAVLLLANFFARRVFLSILGEKYLGLNGLFADVLTLLSLAELGFGNAIVFSLYAPIAKNEVQKIKALMQLYKKVYTVLGIVIIVLGCAFTPFLHLIVENTQEIPHLQAIFILYVLNSGCTYFFSYKRSLFIADQKRYVYAKVHYSVSLMLVGVQIATLYLTKNFFIYLILQILAGIVENIVISILANKAYPYMRDAENEALAAEDKKIISKNIFALFFHRIGSVAINGTSSIITSKFVSLEMVGRRSNYTFVLSGLEVFIGAVSESVTSGFGNLNALAEPVEKQRVFFELQFVFAWIYGFCAACLLSLFAPFIRLWVGEEYMLSLPIVILIVLDFYLRGMRKPVLLARDGMGLYWQDRFRPLFEMVVSITLSIILAQRLGLAGVLLGSILSFLIADFFVEPYFLHKHGLKMKTNKYYVRYLLFFLITTVAVILTFLLCSLINWGGIIAFVCKGIICMVLPNLIFLCAFFKMKEFARIKSLVSSLLKRK